MGKIGQPVSGEGAAVKVEVREIQPTPLPKEYILTLSEHEASVVRRALSELSSNYESADVRAEARKLWDELFSIGVPNLT